MIARLYEPSGSKLKARLLKTRMLQLLRDLPNRKWLLIGWLNHKKGLFNPVLECSGTGLKAAILLPNEALSLAGIICKKGASIHLVTEGPILVTR